MSDIKVPEAQSSPTPRHGPSQVRGGRACASPPAPARCRNGRPFENYFPTEALRVVATQPLTLNRLGRQVRRANHRFWRRPQTARPARCGMASPAPCLRWTINLRPVLKAEGFADPRPAHERAQEVRPAGRAQTLPVQQTLIALDIPRPAGSIRRGFFMKRTKQIAIVGASGYSGEELVRLLLSHPRVELAAVTSRQYGRADAGTGLPEIRPSSARPRAALQ